MTSGGIHAAPDAACHPRRYVFGGRSAVVWGKSSIAFTTLSKGVWKTNNVLAILMKPYNSLWAKALPPLHWGGHADHIGKKHYLRSGSEGEKNLETELSPKILCYIIYARLVFSSAWRMYVEHVV